MLKLMNLLSLVAILLLSACSSKAFYDNAQQNGKQACIEEPPGMYQACLDRYNKSFENYEQERKEVLKPQPPASPKMPPPPKIPPQPKTPVDDDN